MRDAHVAIRGERGRHVGHGASGVEPTLAALRSVLAVPAVPGRLGLAPVRSDHRVEVHGPLHIAVIAAGSHARGTEQFRRRGHLLRPTVRVPHVGGAGDQRQRLLRARPADQNGQPRLDRPRCADRAVEAVEAALVGDLLAVEQPADQRHGLGQAVQPLAEAGPEVEAERGVLALEPARADTQDRPPARHVVHGGGHLGHEAGVAQGVRADHQAQPGPRRDRGDGRQGGPALELGVRPVGLVGEQVVVDPQVVEARCLRPQDGLAQGRPVRALDPERRPESHRRHPLPHRVPIS